MTREEAIKWQETFKKNYGNFAPGSKEACNMAIEALEKHMPIRPIMRIKEKGFNKGCIYPHCPICDTMPVPHPNVSYCDKCGQAIDWSDL